MMFWISAKLTLVMLCVVPPVSLFAVFYGRYIRRLTNMTQEAIGDMSKTAEEKLNAFKTVAAYNSQPLEATLFRSKVDSIFALATKEAYMTGIFWGASGFAGNLAMLSLLGYGEGSSNKALTDLYQAEASCQMEPLLSVT